MNEVLPFFKGPFDILSAVVIVFIIVAVMLVGPIWGACGEASLDKKKPRGA